MVKAGLRDEFLEFLGDVLDGADAVVEEEDLSIAFQLAQDGLAHQVGAVLGYEGFDGQTFLRRRVDDAHIADAGQGHVQGARYGRGGESQNVNLGAHLLEAFLVGDAETVFLVHDDQAEIVESDVLLEDAVGSDDNIGGAGFGGVNDFGLLFGGAETAQYLHLDGIGGEAFGEGGVVLLGQDGGRHQDGDLHTVVDGFEGGAQGDLGFAVAHVAADKAVHGLGQFHVGLDFIGGAELVGGFHVWERVFQIALPGRVGAETMAGYGFTGGVEADEFGGDFAGGAAGALLDALPLAAAEPGERGRVVGGGDVCAQAVELFRGYVQAVVVRVFQHEILAVVAGGFQVRGAGESGNAVVDVDDVAAGCQGR